jgi:hypothetical protein
MLAKVEPLPSRANSCFCLPLKILDSYASVFASLSYQTVINNEFLKDLISHVLILSRLKKARYVPYASSGLKQGQSFS